MPTHLNTFTLATSPGLPVRTSHLPAFANTMQRADLSASGKTMGRAGRMVGCCAPLIFLYAMLAATLHAQPSLTGSWEGAIVLPGLDLGIIVHFTGTDETPKATIDIPMQMAKGLPLINVSVQQQKVHFELQAGPGVAVFDGTRSGDSISGGFLQAGTSARFHLHRVLSSPAAQVLPPPPYRESEVTIVNGEISLAGTLTIPFSGGPHPAAILLTGSGAQNRDEDIFGFRPFWILADQLTRHGFAVLRCDDRGVGGSIGTMNSSTSRDFSSDAMAMLRFLQKHPDIRPDRIGLIGHSEGASVGAMCASTSPDVAFLVLLAGPALPGDSIILSQIEVLGRLQGESEEEIQRGLNVQRRVFETVKSQTGWNEVRELLTGEMRRSFDRLSDGDRTKTPNQDSLLAARVDLQMNALRSPWFTFFVSHDPATDLARVRCPVLALFGELDKQVLPSRHRPALESAIKAGGNTEVTVSVIPQANHLFQEAQTGAPSEYGSLKKEFAKGVLEELVAWLTKRRM